MLSGEVLWVGLVFFLLYAGICVVLWLNRRARRKHSMRFIASRSFLAVCLSLMCGLFCYWTFTVGFTGSLSTVLKGNAYGLGAAVFGFYGFYRNIRKSSWLFGIVFTLLQYVLSLFIAVVSLWILIRR